MNGTRSAKVIKKTPTDDYNVKTKVAFLSRAMDRSMPHYSHQHPSLLSGLK